MDKNLSLLLSVESTDGDSAASSNQEQKMLPTQPEKRVLGKATVGEELQQTAENMKKSRSSWEEQNERSAASKKENCKDVVGRKDFWLAVAVFLLIGLNSLMAWNVMLNLAPYMAAAYFEGQDYGNTLLACFQGVCVVVQITLIYLNCKPKPSFFYVGAILNVAAFLALTPAAAYTGEKTPALVLVHLLCLVLGMACGLLQGTGYVYAGALPVNFAVFVSAGQGLAGLAAFALNTLLGFVFFDLNTYKGLTSQSWALYSICSAWSALLAIGVYFLTSRAWAREPFESKPTELQNSKRPSVVVVRVVDDPHGGKLIGNNTLAQRGEGMEDEGEKERKGGKADCAGLFGTVKKEGEKGSGERWTDLLEAEGSAETEDTLLGAMKHASGLSKTTSMAQAHLATSELTPVSRAAEKFSQAAQETAVSPGEGGGQQQVGTEAELPRRKLLVIAKVMWRPLLAIAVTFFVSLNLFPRIGPVGWHYNQKVPNHFVILFGLFAIGDTLGRSTPSLQMMSRRWLGWTLIPDRIFVWATFARALFYIPFFLSYKLSDRVVLNDFWWLACMIIVFAFTHGWFTSVGFIYAVGTVRDSEKGIAGPLAVVVLSIAILLGLYIALAY